MSKKSLVIVEYFKWFSQQYNRDQVYGFFQAKHTVSDIVKRLKISYISVYAVKMRMNDAEGVNRDTGNGQKVLWIEIACLMQFEATLQSPCANTPGD